MTTDPFRPPPAFPELAAWRDDLLTLRCAWLAGPVPRAEALVIPQAGLDGVLGPDILRSDSAERAAEIASRREHLRWRFRT